ncbi:hypothetical protein CIRG_05274 [Coccidioides immitis RMSCC 2394]|uniref:Uncharacterized protein n=1 Tax=Coccidioides immitis RMSCC 2394 TaxID=404692 RepID=A0A0J6YF75_COCIT|nr:hypothetical protein CIRG_05274 [Coccidioides immitis RMSCC 2394]
MSRRGTLETMASVATASSFLSQECWSAFAVNSRVVWLKNLRPGLKIHRPHNRVTFQPSSSSSR